MRFSSIEIINFRQYKNLTFNFPKTKENDLHIIIGDNGVGKTNILNAVTWCLFDDEPHLGNKSKSLPKINLETKKLGLQKGKKTATITVRISATDNNETIVFCRKLDVNLDRNFEHQSEFTVIVSSGSDANIYTDDEASAFVEKYTPKRIRKFFYFDGEQLDTYFISDESSNIKETIHSISQVDIVTRTKNRLATVIGRKQSEAGKKAPKIQDLKNKLTEKEKQISSLESRKNEVDKQIACSTSIIKQNSEYLSGQENVPDLEQRYNTLQARKVEYEERVKSKLNNMYIFAREMKTALSLYPYATKTLKLIEEKKKNNELPPDIDVNLLKKMLDTNTETCLICKQKLSDDSRDNIKKMLDQIQVSSATSNLLMSINSELLRIVDMSKDYINKRDEILNDYKIATSDLKQCEIDLQKTDDELSKFSNKEKVIKWHNERKEQQKLKEINLGNKALIVEQLKRSNEDYNLIKENLNKEISKVHECERINKLIIFATESQKIVERIETEMMTEVREKMERRTMEYFNKLIWKKGVYDHITLDDNYQLDLIHVDDYSCVGSCSAAERSLLALSFTLSLHEVSGFNSLLFIDTPVARVSSQNRVNFASVLKEVSKNKQLIMAFSPDEYSESIRCVFDPIASTSVHLTMNDNNNITVIREEV